MPLSTNFHMIYTTGRASQDKRKKEGETEILEIGFPFIVFFAL